MPKAKSKPKKIPGPAVTAPKKKTLTEWVRANKASVSEAISNNYDLSAQFSTAIGEDAKLWALDAAAEIARVFNIQGLAAGAEEETWQENFTRNFGSWLASGNIPASGFLHDANQTRMKLATAQRNAKRRFASDMGFTGRGEGDEAFEMIEVEHLDPAKFYPTTGWFVSETEEARVQWHKHLQSDWWHDGRRDRRYAWPLDKGSLKLNIPSDKSCILVDKKTKKIIAVVIRDFCRDDGVLAWVDFVIRHNLDIRKSVRVSF